MAKRKSNLLPCPFCGSTDHIVEQADFSSAVVICSNCGGQGPTCNPEKDGDDELGEAAAVRAWNARPTPGGEHG